MLIILQITEPNYTQEIKFITSTKMNRVILQKTITDLLIVDLILGYDTFNDAINISTRGDISEYSDAC